MQKSSNVNKKYSLYKFYVYFCQKIDTTRSITTEPYPGVFIYCIFCKLILFHVVCYKEGENNNCNITVVVYSEMDVFSCTLYSVLAEWMA